MGRNQLSTYQIINLCHMNVSVHADFAPSICMYCVRAAVKPCDGHPFCHQVWRHFRVQSKIPAAAQE